MLKFEAKKRFVGGVDSLESRMDAHRFTYRPVCHIFS